MNKVLQAVNLSKGYQLGSENVQVLKDVNLTIAAGDMLAIVGSSGSGKTTLLNLLAGLDRCDQGQVIIQGQDLQGLSDRQVTRLRNQHLGFVFQFHHLLPEFTALENVLMPIRLAGKVSAQQQAYALQLLDRVGLSQRLRHKPAELSGGERQRVAIARSLVHQPALVFMDEPTGNLDESTSEQIQELIGQLNRELSSSFVIVTHSVELASRLPTCYRIRQGVLERLERSQ